MTRNYLKRAKQTKTNQNKTKRPKAKPKLTKKSKKCQNDPKRELH